MDDSIRSAITLATAPLHEELGALRERVDLSEAISASRDESERGSEGSESSDVSAQTFESVLADEGSYLRVDPKSNNHFGAPDLANGGDFKPHRHDLYGERPMHWPHECCR